MGDSICVGQIQGVRVIVIAIVFEMTRITDARAQPTLYPETQARGAFLS